VKRELWNRADRIHANESRCDIFYSRCDWRAVSFRKSRRRERYEQNAGGLDEKTSQFPNKKNSGAPQRQSDGEILEIS